MQIKEQIEATKKNIVVSVSCGNHRLTYRLPLNSSANLLQDISDKLARKLLNNRRKK